MPNAVSAHAIAPLDERLRAVLQKYWGFDTLRPLQREAIDAALAKRDSLVILPTGGGKSLCYQVPPLLLPGLSVVVSPLIALMKDQVDALVLAGYPAAALNSTTSNADAADIRRRALGGAGELKLLLVAPERLLTESFLSFLVKAKVTSVAIDEAHCISQWGHDFRPEYRRLAELRSVFSGVPLHAYTATATPRVRDDIVAQLGLVKPALLTGRFDRPNLTYRVLPRINADAQVEEVLRRQEAGAAIVYCMSRKETERIAATLRSRKIKAAAYHAGLDPRTRHDVQDDFTNERLNVVVATVAFGMGIDRSDVRCVIHASMPKSVEHYQQETGRAGRDGLPSECVLLYSSADAIKWKGLMEKSAAESDSPPDPDAMAAQLELLGHMQRFCSSARCRHRALSEYFGQKYEPPTPAERTCNSEHSKGGEELRGRVEVGMNGLSAASSQASSPSPSAPSPSPLSLPCSCNACDVCLNELDLVPDSSIVAQKIVSCVARLSFMGADGTPRGYGAAYIADVLRGSRAAKIAERAHDKLSTFGLLAQLDKEDLVSMINQLIDAGCLARAGLEFPTIIAGPHARALLKGDMPAALLRPRLAEGAASGKDGSRGRGYTADGTKARALSHQEHALFDTLRSLRRAIAADMSVPPFVVFSDAVLEDLCRVRPGTLATFGTVRGVGQRKQATFGERFVGAIVDHCRATGLDLDAASADPAPLPLPRRPSASSTPKIGTSGSPSRPFESLPEACKAACRMFERGASLDEVARDIGRARSTTANYLAEFIQRFKPATVSPWVDDLTYQRVTEAAANLPSIPEPLDYSGPRIGAIYQSLAAKHAPADDAASAALYEQIRVVISHREALSRP